MTPPTPAPREAGREMDALVAEQVMGWTDIRTTSRESHDTFYTIWLVPTGITPDGAVAEWPHYTTDMAAAWLVVEAMREKGIYLDVETRRENYCVDAGWEGKDGDDIWKQSAAFVAETPALAICRAALAALSARETGQQT